MNVDEIKRLSLNIDGIPSKGYSGDFSQFAELSGTINYNLPEAYIQFLTLMNGGHPELNCFYPQKHTGYDFSTVDEFYSVGDVAGVQNLKDDYFKWIETLGEESLPIGEDGGGNQIFLKFECGYCGVWMYFTEGRGSEIKVSDSFEEFILSLFKHPDLI